MEEIYKVGKNGYLVSNYGNVKGKYVEYLKKSITQAGYVTYGGKLGSGHRLVWETFMSEIPDGMEINHMDLNKLNNRLDNLELVTRSENQKHVHQNGGYKIVVNGENNPMATLTENDVLNIYEMIKDGKENMDIAIKYNIHDRYVSLIRHGKRWKYLYSQHFNISDYYYSFGNNNLTRDDTMKVLDLVTKSNLNNAEIARLYNLDPSVISRVRSKQTWIQSWKFYQKGKHLINIIN